MPICMGLKSPEDLEVCEITCANPVQIWLKSGEDVWTFLIWRRRSMAVYNKVMYTKDIYNIAKKSSRNF